ncbi:MAG: phospholipase D family protein, partial [Pseudomonadota bacterium]|nr:phospholipase D family protein [Pseudomonadota bacterium]
EIGLYVESPELARRLTVFLNEGVSLKNSYRLELDDNGRILWKSEEDGKIVTFTSDPGSTLGQRFTSGIIATLPVEGQL